MSEILLKEEWEYFHSIKEDLLKDHEGKFVLVKGKRLIGAFDTAEKAYEEGVKAFGNTPFFIKQVMNEEPPEHIPALALGILRIPSQRMPIHNLFYKDQANNPAPQFLKIRGPILRVEITLPRVLAELLTPTGQPIPPPIGGLALFDTGASISAVNESHILGLGVKPVGVTMVNTPTGQHTQNLYPARFVFPDLPGTPSADFAQVLGAQLTPFQDIIALVGRDLLKQFVLTYNGPGAFYTIAY